MFAVDHRIQKQGWLTELDRDDTRPASNPQLTADEIATFENDGFLIRPSLFSRAEVDLMCSSFDHLLRMAERMASSGLQDGSHFVLGERDGQQIVKRVVWAGGSQPALLSIGEDPRLVAPAAQLLGSTEMDQLLSQAHFKRPGDGVIFDWHQDIQHRDKGDGLWRDVNGRGSFVQTLIVLDEMTPDSGPLQFVPGSSRWGRVDFGDHDYDDPDYTPIKPPQFRDEDVVTIQAQPGDTIFFGPYVAHASYENTSNQFRRVFINGYAYPGANSRNYPGEGAGRRLHAQ